MLNNPLFAATPVPSFDKIDPKHFKEAFETVFKEIETTYLQIKETTSEPSIENTLLPFDILFSEYRRVMQILHVFYRNIRSDQIPSLMKESNLRANLITKKIFQDRILGARFKSIYDNRLNLPLDREDLWFLQNLYYKFESSGAFLKKTDQQTLLDIDANLIKEAQTCFDTIMGSARKQQAILINDPEELLGISEEKISVFASQASQAGYSQGWLFIPERLLVDELLEVASHRGFRQKIHEAMNRVGTQTPYDNETTIKEVARLRDTRSRLLGYKNFAQYQQSRNMAGSLERVESILDKSIHHLLPKYEEDMRTLENWVKLQKGPFPLEPWDVAYYSSQYKKEVLGFDASKLTQHLELENVLKGWIQHASKSMNLHFSPTDAYPVWDPDVRVFDIEDKDSKERSVLYLDLYSRPATKDGGAWMSQIQSPDKKKGHLNTIIFNMNLAKPSRGQKGFLDKDQNGTFYHEGGHALNGIKGQRAKYQSQRGTGNGSSFVEIHSIMQERVPYTKEVLPTYAFEPTTHKLPDPKLIEAMHQADYFLATRDALKIIQNAKRDLLLHSQSWENFTTTQDIEKKSSFQSSYSAHVRSYPLRRFDHLFGSALSQYAAGYCGYYLASIAQATASEPFIEKGLYADDLLQKQREFYSIGAGLEPNEAYEAFTGKKLGNLDAYLKSLGIFR